MPLKTDSSKNLVEMYGIGLFTFILFLSTLIGVPVLPKLSQELGASDAMVPLILSASLITVVIAQFFTGILTDRWSKRRLILIGAIFGSVSSLLVVFATSWVQVLWLRIFAGIADAIAMPALLVITSNLGKDQPGRFFGILRGSQGLSFMVGPALGSLFSLISLRAPFLADGIFSLVAFFAAFKLIKDDSKTQAPHNLSVFKGIRQLLGNKRVYLFLLLGFSGMFAFGILQSFVPTKAQILGFEPWRIGVILSVGALVHSVTAFTVGPLSDRYGRKLFAILSQIVVIGSAVALIFFDGFYSILIVFGIFVIGETIPFLLSVVYASESFDRKYLGTSLAIFDSIIDLSLAVGPFLAILVFGLSGRIDFPFLVAIIPAVVCLVVVFYLPEKGSVGDVAHSH